MRPAMTSLVFVSLLLVAIMASTVSSNGAIASCCLTTSNTQIRRENLIKYYVQDRPQCPIHAVVFTTLSLKRICADPERLWTQTSMAFIDGKNYHRQRSSYHR
ncbi:monocyte chemotactic protein 1B-like [Acanthopagrus latus]|uniref:monocyte chemotactic protein 1B-like n=1 Tax=Acanthopagrus latus TaxID=8177 RepID=UPI00187BF74F|nr:monocyte chemotactic protein 1B-like [Acanthopagrus latus]